MVKNQFYAFKQSAVLKNVNYVFLFMEDLFCGAPAHFVNTGKNLFRIKIPALKFRAFDYLAYSMFSSILKFHLRLLLPKNPGSLRSIVCGLRHCLI